MSATSHFLNLTPRDPLIARDGRPFSDGLRMRSLDWFYPSVLAGSLRTLLGNMNGGFPPPSTPEYQTAIAQLKALEIAGPFPTIEDQLCFPAPRDITVKKNADDSLDTFAARPVAMSKAFHGAGSNLPIGIEPAVLPASIGDDFKPDVVPTFWSCDQTVRWLRNDVGVGFLAAGVRAWPAGCVSGPAKDVRTHVQLDFASGAGKDGMLFQSTGLAVERFGEQTSNGLAARVICSADDFKLVARLDQWHPLGGERRLIGWRTASAPRGWDCPEPIQDALKNLQARPHQFVRLMLASPALFADGWKPGWLRLSSASSGMVGEVPGTNVTVRLISAIADRWKPLSGWSYEPPCGPKAVRRLVPAGAIYFLKIVNGDPFELAHQWLASVCDDEQVRRDGFGLALWGTWRPVDSSDTFET